jgi:Fur family ferric uptake transcriptional regulator
MTAKRRDTRQRAVIWHALDEAPGPLTVEELFGVASQQLPRLGIATVYRTVKMLEEDGEIVLVKLPDGLSRYEPASREEHRHFSCTRCTRTFDVDLGPQWPNEVELAGGFVIQHHEVTLFGLCPECRQ